MKKGLKQNEVELHFVPSWVEPVMPRVISRRGHGREQQSRSGYIMAPLGRALSFICQNLVRILASFFYKELDKSDGYATT